MSDFIIATASTSDLDREYLDKHGIEFIPYTYMLDGRTFYDDCRSDTRKSLFDAMRKGQMPSTSQIPEKEYRDFFKKLLDTGKDVLFFDMSKAMSSSYDNSLSAYEKIKDDHPGQELRIVDTRCITGGLAFLLMDVVRLKESGATFKECSDYADEHKMNVVHHFAVDDLKWLRKGGRLSNASAVIGTLLNIKPILYVSDEGTLIASSKVRGRKTCLQNMIDAMAKDIGDPAGKEIVITHGDCEDEAREMAKKMKDMYPSLSDIHLLMLGPTIGSHVGPGFIGVFYYGSGRFF